jgi:hypothetical protein
LQAKGYHYLPLMTTSFCTSTALMLVILLFAALGPRGDADHPHLSLTARDLSHGNPMAGRLITTNLTGAMTAR